MCIADIDPNLGLRLSFEDLYLFIYLLLINSFFLSFCPTPPKFRGERGLILYLANIQAQGKNPLSLI